MANPKHYVDNEKFFIEVKKWKQRVIDAREVDVDGFNKPGTAIVFPSFINHKVTKLISGERHTLSIWWYGPKFK